MKKLILGLLCFVALSMNAETSSPQSVPVRVEKLERSIGTEVRRAPSHFIPVEIYYYPDTGSVVVTGTGDGDILAEVFLYGELGILEDYSPILESTLTATTGGIHLIQIKTDDWIAIGEFEIE